MIKRYSLRIIRFGVILIYHLIIAAAIRGNKFASKIVLDFFVRLLR